MSQYYAEVKWQRQTNERYVDNQYSRGHSWIFDGGVTVPASASPQVVPLPYSIAENVDPEEAFVAALSSCHMLFFLSIAAKRQFLVDEYVDHAVGIMQLNAEGKMAMTQVTLRPNIVFAGEKQPTNVELDAMHHESHEQCFIANSVKTQVVIESHCSL
jgi:organic hydroperoxide reductase OsmC/OhrA